MYQLLGVGWGRFNLGSAKCWKPTVAGSESDSRGSLRTNRHKSGVLELGLSAPSRDSRCSSSSLAASARCARDVVLCGGAPTVLCVWAAPTDRLWDGCEVEVPESLDHPHSGYFVHFPTHSRLDGQLQLVLQRRLEVC